MLNDMKVLGVDPGYGRAGVALIERRGTSEQLVYSSCIVTHPGATIDTRLLACGNEFDAILSEHSPDALAMETLYFGKNKKTAIAVAEMRGIFRYLAAARGVPLFEYNPMTVKSALSANSKQEVMTMVERLVKLPPKKGRLDDEYDAIAIGLTHLAVAR